MRWLGLAIGALLVMFGVLSFAAQDQFLSMLRALITMRAGIYVIAGARIVTGLVFLIGAPESRLPKPMRLLGILVIIAGLLTPAFGVARALRVLDLVGHGGPGAPVARAHGWQLCRVRIRCAPTDPGPRHWLCNGVRNV